MNNVKKVIIFFMLEKSFRQTYDVLHIYYRKHNNPINLLTVFELLFEKISMNYILLPIKNICGEVCFTF